MPSHVPLLLLISNQLQRLTLLLLLLPSLALSLRHNFCGNMAVKYPFVIDDGCGVPQFSKMLNCSTDLFFQTPSGNYKVQSIDYDKHTVVIYDPAMSTCSILQPHHDFVMSEVCLKILKVLRFQLEGHYSKDLFGLR